MLATLASSQRCLVYGARPFAFREFAARPGTSIGRRILDSIRQARESLQSPSTSNVGARSLTDALSDLGETVTNPELPPTILEGNREMLRKLQGFCLRLSYASSFPPKSTLRVQFAIKKPSGIEYARGLLRTTGTDCSDSVHSELTGLFAKAGIDPQFQFLEQEFEGGRRAFLQAMYRKSKGLPARPQLQQQQPPQQQEGPTVRPPGPLTAEQIGSLQSDVEAEVNSAMEKEAAAQRWTTRMKTMDPLFSALAAVPWVSELDPEKARHVQTSVLDTLEGDGWDIRGAVHKIWAGARDYQKLRAGLDPGSSDAIKAVLRHAQQYDEQYGFKPFTPTRQAKST